MRISERLLKARALISDIDNWCQHNLSIKIKQKKGSRWRYQYCATGALNPRAARTHRPLDIFYSDVKVYLENFAPASLPRWQPSWSPPRINEVNDYRYFSKKKAHSKVLEIYDMAISAALSDEAMWGAMK